MVARGGVSVGQNGLSHLSLPVKRSELLRFSSLIGAGSRRLGRWPWVLAAGREPEPRA